MITEIPTTDDFFKSGLSMLNLAWDTVATLYRNLDNAGIEEWDDDGEVTEEFWQAAQRPISIALALSQQGIELLLKGKIAAVSPFLLIVGSPRDWPSGCTEKDTPFAVFQTIEAHELIRAHDTIMAEKLSISFKEEFEKLRRFRNIIFHGVDNQLRPTAESVFKIILESVNSLIGYKTWVNIRREYLENTPESVAYSPDHVEEQLIFEIETVIRLLKPADIKSLLGFDKKQRTYICYQCAVNSRDAEIRPKIAQLNPNTPDSNKVYCLICDRHYEVLRKNCGKDGCLGNVIDAEDGVCLTCYL